MIKPRFGDPRFSFLAKAAELTGWSDQDLATLTGLGRSTVQAYRSGRLPEYLDGKQTQAVMNALRLFRDQITEEVARIEMMT